MENNLEQQYDLAVKSGEIERQAFLDALQTAHPVNGVRKLRYVPMKVCNFTKGDMTIHINGKCGVREIYAFDKAFNQSFENFLGIALEHEAHHVRQSQCNYRHFMIFSHMMSDAVAGDYAKAILELPAYLHQTTDLCKHHLDFEGNTELGARINYFEEQMKSEAAKLNVNWRRDLFRVLCPSPFDDIVRWRYAVS